ncbi:hypothetical protein OS187_06410 [Xanthomonadaceae bacterium JHOS43]|nr:hypothetical protein [Xanthomonadaceae bacterium JHOS43]MCX7563051.1 hypothetical protein [Xanthomonadaceae bacterium XH05]
MPSCFRSILAALLLSPCAYAADFVVTRTDDPVPNGCAPTDCSLREALIAANAIEGNDRILLAAGEYFLSQSAPPPPEAPGTSGPLPISDSVEIVGVGRDATRIVPTLVLGSVLGIGHDSDLVFATLRDLSIEGAVSTAPAPIFANENTRLRLERVAMRNNTGSTGAIAAVSHLTIIDSLFEANNSVDDGPIVTDLLGPTLITGSEFRNNSMYGEFPSVVRMGLPIALAYTPLGDRVVSHNQFAGNLSNGNGAAVTLLASIGQSRLALTDNRFEDNRSTGRGGALWVGVSPVVPTTRVEVDVSGSDFLANRANGGCGAIAFDAPVELLAAPELNITLAHFAGNQTDGDGGALCSTGAITIRQTTFSGNTSNARGGAIHHDNGLLRIERSTLSNNAATGAGGAIAAYDPIEIRYSTLDGNTTSLASSGGALYLAHGGGNESLLRHATLFGNRANNTPNALRVFSLSNDTSLRLDDSILQGGCTTNAPASLIDSRQNIESPGNTCGLSSAFNSVNVAPATLGLGPLTDNGGPTLTRMPQPGSPALNRIIMIPSCTHVDQRGYVGTGGNCDIGAVEAGANPPQPVLPEIFSDDFE